MCDEFFLSLVSETYSEILMQFYALVLSLFFKLIVRYIVIVSNIVGF